MGIFEIIKKRAKTNSSDSVLIFLGTNIPAFGISTESEELVQNQKN